MSTAVSIDPSGDFDGNDGRWSTFPFQIGTPPQMVKLLIATSGQETWVITPDACTATDAKCRNGHGYLFNISASSTWNDQAFYQLSDEANLGYTGTGYYGFDNVTIGWEGELGVTVNHSVIAGTPSPDFYVGLFGLSPRPTNFSDFRDSHPSFLTLLKDSSQIPSLSYGYTAGAYYRNSGTQASLTFGGYDNARFENSNISFDFNPVTYRDIVVGVSTLSRFGSAESRRQNFLEEDIFAFIDAGTPHIWLPESACHTLEAELGLQYVAPLDLYLIFPKESPEQTVNITLPYSAFDLELTTSYSNLTNNTYYFPLRRAANETQYTLGRTFLQEAYMVVDYERQNFSISQCKWDGGEKRLFAIDPPPSNKSTPETTSKEFHNSHLSTPIVVAIVVSALIGVSLAVATLFYLKKRRKSRAIREEVTPSTPELDSERRVEVEVGLDRPELYAGQRHELEGDKFQAELNGVITGELDSATVHELDAE